MVRVRTTCESVTRKTALQAIITKFGQRDDIIISQLQAIFQLFSSYPPLGRVFPSWLMIWKSLVIGGCRLRSVFAQKSGPNISEREFRTFVSI